MSWNDNWNSNEYGRSTWGSKPVANKSFKDESESDEEPTWDDDETSKKKETKKEEKHTKEPKDESSDEGIDEERKMWEKSEKEENKEAQAPATAAAAAEEEEGEEEAGEDEDKDKDKNKPKNKDKDSGNDSDVNDSDTNKETLESQMKDLTLGENAQKTNGTAADSAETKDEQDKSDEKQKKAHKRRKKKKKMTLPGGQKKCVACHKLTDEKSGQVKNEQFYCSPCASKLKCSECQRWLDPSLGKADDQEGVWYCFRCWNKWEKSQQRYWTQQDPDQYLSTKMKKIDKEWSKGGGW